MTATPSAGPRGRGRRLSWTSRRRLTGIAFALPTAALVAVFFIWPLLLVGQMSASDWRLLSGDRGLNFPRNFESLDANPLFWPALEFTIRYTVIVTVLLIGIGLILALIVQESGRWSAFLRTAFVLPLAVGLAAASLLFWGFYAPEVGPLSPPLQAVGLIEEPLLFFTNHLMSLGATVFLVVWKYVGLYMLILLVGLQQIPDDVYEAAAIDGASRWQTLRRITLPLLRPSIALALILSVTGSLLAFDQFFLLTRGGPDNSTVTVVQLIYQQAFTRQNLGVAAALSVILLVALLALNMIWFRMLRRGSAEGSA